MQFSLLNVSLHFQVSYKTCLPDRVKGSVPKLLEKKPAFMQQLLS
jgi:hypothetical protein